MLCLQQIQERGGLDLTIDAAKSSLEGERVGVEIERSQHIREISQQAQTATAILEEQEPLSQKEAEARLALYKYQYDYPYGKINKRKFDIGCYWDTIEKRLLADGGHKLARVEALQGKGRLFGMDENGKVLFADQGVEPVLRDMDYFHTRERVHYDHDKNGKMIERNGKPVPTGYELFPHKDVNWEPWAARYQNERTGSGYYKSNIIIEYEQNIQEPIVGSSNERESRSIWLESGDAPNTECLGTNYPDKTCWVACFDPSRGWTYVAGGAKPQYSIGSWGGTKRLYRV